MKNFRKTVACIIAAAFLLIMTSCSSEKVVNAVNDHLEIEYPGQTFSVKEYTKRTETSGRYEVDVVCQNDNVDFQMYIYSNILSTDSYSVEKANNVMSGLIVDQLTRIHGDVSDVYKKIQWLDIYDDDAVDYRFRSVDISGEITLEDAKSIYRVELCDGLTISYLGEAIYDFLNMFYSYTPYEFDKATFAYTINQISYEFTIDAKYAHENGKPGVIDKILSNMVTAADKNGKFIVQPVKFSALTEELPAEGENK